MRPRHSLPLLATAAACLLVAAFVVVPLGPFAGGPVGGSGAGPSAGGGEIRSAADAASPAGSDGVDSALGEGPGAGSPELVGGSLAPSGGAGVPLATGAAGQIEATAAPGVAGSNGPGLIPGNRSPSIARSTPLVNSVQCPIFPASNVWNKDISGLPVAGNSTTMINAIGRYNYLHPDFDAVGDGIPYNVVTSSTPKYSVGFDYADESDPGPYPIPASPKIEGGSDRHMLMLDKGACRLYELYAVSKSGSTWHAGSGAIWNLRSNALRPDGWTSADAAGLPILPGLVLYSEVQAGAIKHALRFTASDTCGYIYPARHLTASPCANLPPMGLRVRLKASVNISGFGPQAQVVLTALKRYGMILADNGSPWYVSGEPNAAWNDDELHHLQNLTGADFEVVDTSGLRNG